MILRRLSQSLKEQNWTAIWIEFILLASGVFLGIQVSNWNAARVDRAEYEAALTRLGAEIDTNLASLEEFDSTMALDLEKAGRALTVLQTCVESDQNREIVEVGLNVIRGTEGLRPRRNALDDMTSNPRLLSQQTAKERKRFSELLFFYDALQPDAEFSNFNPLVSGMENNPILRIGPPINLTRTYFGKEWPILRRNLELNVPLSEACRNNQLIKAFFNWERRQGNLPNIAQIWRTELTATKNLIEARR